MPREDLGGFWKSSGASWQPGGDLGGARSGSLGLARGRWSSLGFTRVHSGGGLMAHSGSLGFTWAQSGSLGFTRILEFFEFSAIFQCIFSVCASSLVRPQRVLGGLSGGPRGSSGDPRGSPGGSWGGPWEASKTEKVF